MASSHEQETYMSEQDLLLPCVESGAQEAARASVIWLHGLGADGHDFEPIVPELALQDLAVRFIFPHAPRRAVTINNGYVMRAWFDIVSPDLSRDVDSVSIEQSTYQLHALIDREIARGIPASKIILAGFSQGGVIVLQGGLRYREKLAGVLALSTFLAEPAVIQSHGHKKNLHTPIMMMHGDYDDVIPIAAAQRSREILLKMDYQVDWQSYPMGHGVIPEELTDIATWLRQQLNA
jgi:phospholipase/carboxylesterase